MRKGAGLEGLREKGDGGEKGGGERLRVVEMFRVSRKG